MWADDEKYDREIRLPQPHILQASHTVNTGTIPPNTQARTYTYARAYSQTAARKWQ